MEALIALGGELTLGGSSRPVAGIKVSDVFTIWTWRDVDQAAPAALPSRVPVLMDDRKRVINATKNAGDNFHMSCYVQVIWPYDIGTVKEEAQFASSSLRLTRP